MSYLSIGAQTPLPSDLEDKQLENRLKQASKETIKRSSAAIHTLIHFFQDQIAEPSQPDWSESISETLDKLRFQTLDLIQALFSLEYLDMEQKEKAELAITQGTEKSKEALTFSASPIANLSRLLTVSSPFFLEIGQCLEDSKSILSGLAQRPTPTDLPEKKQSTPN